ncbi:MAG: hypothetical protein E6J91_25725 [Deltaproteobacteria bacterium]|nr:MAG: hypothetical protein E6J91_25725 [Deltaproteobacteria bacterium]
MGVRTGSLIAAAVTVAFAAQAEPPGRIQITVWATPPPPSGELYGGLAYGGYAPITGALVTEQRDVEIAGGEARVSGVAATLDPASVQLRDLTDPAAVMTAQRFLPSAATPTEILTRHIGDPVSVTTPRGELGGTLRAVDDQVIAVETGAGDQRHLEILRREGFVQGVRLPPGTTGDPSLAWRVRTAKPGKHTIELSYRADGMSWSADYVAVLDEPGRAVDLASWATIKNATGASFDAAELTLVGVGADPAPGAGRIPPARFRVPGPVRIGRGDAVQVELVPRRTAVPVRSVILYEAMLDPSPRFQAVPGTECSQFSGVGSGNGRTDVAIEIDVPGRVALPDGKVRLFQRRAGHLEVVSEDPLRTAAGIARIRVVANGDITGDRHAVSCNYDEQRHTVQETIELKLENRTPRAADVILREFLWRWPIWHIESEDHKGVRAGPQLQEYRVRVPGSGRQVVTYTAVYAW